MQLVDLSVLLNEDTPVYPGDPKTKIQPAGKIARDGYTDHIVSFGTHVGTHIDAPLHMIERGSKLSEIPIEQLVGRGRYCKVEANFSLEHIKNLDLQPEDIVLFDTGMSQKYYTIDYFEQYPVMSEEIANYIVERKVKMVGLDACSVDIAEGFPIHKILLGGNVLIIENLTNVQSLEGKRFQIYALPLKLDLDGSPARVIAVID